MKIIIYIFCMLLMTNANAAIWESSIDNEKVWDNLTATDKTIEYTKFIIDKKTNKIYFIDVNVFQLHVNFVLDYLEKKPQTQEYIDEYNKNYDSEKPHYILGYLTRYNDLNIMTFSFWEGDAITYYDIAKVKEILNKTLYVKNILFRPDSTNQEKLIKPLLKLGVESITNDKIYKATPYRAFTTGEAIGKLNIINPEDSSFQEWNDDEIVVLSKSYLDISHVSGIINIKETTPLSHVNLRAKAWGIPSANILKEVDFFKEYNGKYVVLNVYENEYSLRLATDSEIKLSQIKTPKFKLELPEINKNEKNIKKLSKISLEESLSYGAKTANLGNILKQKISGLNVPNGYGIPFYYYINHIDKKLQKDIEIMLKDKRFGVDNLWTKESLLIIQEKIKNKPINKSDLQKIVQIWKKDLNMEPVFIRSSTNSEDLRGFNGAGLYDTVPNVQTEEQLENAIKQVWASIWNERAVKERMHYKIEHNKVYPAILMQIGIKAVAAGVLITKDIFTNQPMTYTINANKGLGIKVVDGKKIPEQVLYDSRNDGIRIISRSSENKMLVMNKVGDLEEIQINPGEIILQDKIILSLGKVATKILKSYNMPLDIEWVIDNKQVWIVQVRPYID